MAALDLKGLAFMNVFLTGGTGYVGSAVLRDLLAHGHSVTALVRSEASADKVKEAGATPVVGDITDVPWLTDQLTRADAAVHTASPGDATSAEVDKGVATAVAVAFQGSGKPYVHTGGVWVYGSKTDITEQSPFDAPAITSWRAAVEETVLEADTRTVLIVPAIVYGQGQGIPAFALTGAPQTDGALHLVGDGTQHWGSVHVDDLADLYVRALENDAASGTYIADGGHPATVAELGEAASRGLGLGGRVTPESLDAGRERLGAAFADALFLDQVVVSTKAADDLGWKPSAAPLVEDLASGSYTG